MPCISAAVRIAGLGLRRQPPMRVVEFVSGFVVIMHFGQHWNAAIAAAAAIVFGKLLLEFAHNARNNQRMLGRQEAAIAARRIQRRLQNRFHINLISVAVDEFLEPLGRLLRSFFA